ncbi:MAG: PAS domain S-box protein [Candidatus Omnitrophica bacterium]|nr:PAS domain S-box protein [Candidatus Omnitrophota bacterium]MCF7894060.1 PAS domain S-box protein [Candidatus Omnitrophota bacterium]
MKVNNHFQLTSVVADNLEAGLFRYSLAPDNKFISFNNSFLKLVGCTGVELSLKKIDILFSSFSDKNIFFNLLNRGGPVRLFHTKPKDKDDWVAVSAAIVYTQDKQKIIEGLVQDISHQKKMHDHIFVEKHFLENLLDNLPDAVYFKDIESRIIKANRFYIQGTGLAKEEIMGKTDFDFFSFEQAQEMFKDDQQVISSGKPLVGKIEKTTLSDGSKNQVITTKIPMHDKQGKIIGTMGITRDITAHANLEEEKFSMMINTLEVLGKALELRDPYTFNHTRFVSKIAQDIASELRWDAHRLLGIKLAGELHDLGKIAIPIDILNRPGKLSDLEYSLIKEHSHSCYELMKDFAFPFPLAKAVYQHHERIDGSGYPQGLTSKEIITEAKVLAVSDVLEAMTSHRPYREALGIENAKAELKSGRGSKYDPEIVDIAIDLIEKNDNKIFWKN